MKLQSCRTDLLHGFNDELQDGDVQGWANDRMDMFKAGKTRLLTIFDEAALSRKTDTQIEGAP